MFDVGFNELLLVAIIGLLVLGPERLPKVAAQVGRWVARARRTATQFRQELEREIALSEIAKAERESREEEEAEAAAAAEIHAEEQPEPESESDAHEERLRVDAPDADSEPDGRGRPETDVEEATEAAAVEAQWSVDEQSPGEPADASTPDRPVAGEQSSEATDKTPTA